jgi:hypothetical protein
MPVEFDYRVIDLALFICANLVNLLITAMFVARAKHRTRLGQAMGLSAVALGLPVAIIALLNLLAGRAWWTVALPALYVLYALLELGLDYIFKVEFRRTRLLWPYLTIYYLGVLALVGYSFSVGRLYGFITLGTYFLCLFATWYAYSRVGHGRSGSQGRVA